MQTLDLLGRLPLLRGFQKECAYRNAKSSGIDKDKLGYPRREPERDLCAENRAGGERDNRERLVRQYLGEPR